MRWPWCRPPEATKEAEEARKEARRALADARNFHQRVDQVTSETRKIGLRNHFAESLELAIIPRSAK